MMINLREKDLQTLHAIAKAGLPRNADLWAYGSRVNGDAHDTSDLDLVVKTPKSAPLDRDVFKAFKEALQNSNIPILIQVLDWNIIPEHFKSNIERRYFVVQEASQ